MNCPRKEAICNALAAFIRQPPGLEYVNYGSAASYQQDARRAQRQKRDAESLLLAVRHNPGITADAMLAAADGSSGRVTLVHKDKGDGHYWYGVDYCTGQYFPTEFRGAVARYLSGLLWDWQRENMPQMGSAPVGSGKAEAGMYYHADSNRSMNAGDWLRRTFRQQFGSALQKRYFD